MNKKLGGLLAGLVFSSMSNISEATLMWDFTVSGTDFTGSGRIEFAAPSCDGSSLCNGLIDFFSFEATAENFDVFPIPVPVDITRTFGIADLDALGISWSIGDDWSLNALNISGLIDETPPDSSWPPGFGPLTYSFNLTETSATYECNGAVPFIGCYGIGGAGDITSFSRTGTPEFRADHTVPEPSTLALLALGFAGFGFVRRKRLN